MCSESMYANGREERKMFELYFEQIFKGFEIPPGFKARVYYVWIARAGHAALMDFDKYAKIKAPDEWAVCFPMFTYE